MSFKFELGREAQDGEPKSAWFDEERLQVTGEVMNIAATPTGGPAPGEGAPTR